MWGDGTGPIRMQLLSGNTQTRFVSTIDNVAIWNTVPVPEPSSYALALAGLACGGSALQRRRTARQASVSSAPGNRRASTSPFQRATASVIEAFTSA